MRGKAAFNAGTMSYARITPAYAGKSRRSLKTRPVIWDHPRLCGEKTPLGKLYEILRGSPPPMRGKGQDICEQIKKIRITPAYAGKRKNARPFLGAVWDHPRLCGEKINSSQCDTLLSGSPPPMRGKGPFCGGSLFEVGITPAYAGKSNSIDVTQTNFQDHPRLCGEKSNTFKDVASDIGSPPPMRGKGKNAN